MISSIEFSITGIPPSYSKELKINYRLKNVYLSQKGRNYKTKVKLNTPRWELPDRPLIFNIYTKYYSNWYYKNGKVKKVDVQNMDRLLIDAVFSTMGRDDSFLWKVTNEKVQSDEERTVVKMEAYEVGDYGNE